MPTPPNIVTLHQRPDGSLILERGYDTTPVRYMLIEKPEEERTTEFPLYCLCTHPDSWHESGEGECIPDCGCMEFFLDRVPTPLPPVPMKPGLVNENEYSTFHLRRAQRPVEAHNDEHDLNHLESGEGRENGVQSVREA